MKNRKGFTLVELVIVIAVIAILSAVLLPTFAGILERARENTRLNQATSARDEFLAQNLNSISEMENYLIIVDDNLYIINSQGQINKFYGDLETLKQNSPYDYPESKSTILKNAIIYEPVLQEFDDMESVGIDINNQEYNWNELIENNLVSVQENVLFNISKNLTKLIIDKSITQIGDENEYGNPSQIWEAENLKTLIIPSTTTIIKNGSLSLLNLETLQINNNPIYNSPKNSNVIIETATNTLIVGTCNCTIPSTVKSIGNYAFQYCDVSNLVIPYGVENIGEMSFYRAANLVNVKLPTSITFLAENCFGYSYEVEYEMNLTYENDNICYFSGYDENGNEYDHYFAFKVNESAIGEISLHENTRVIASMFAQRCYDITKLTIHKGITSIGDGIVYYCTSLQSVEISDDNKYYTDNNQNLIIENSTKKLIGGGRNITQLPPYIKILGRYSLCEYTFTEIVLPTNLERIENSAIGWCRNLISINIPANVEYIGEHSFSSCLALKTLTFDTNCKLKTIDKNAFLSCSALTGDLIIPNDIRLIEFYAFKDCSKIQNLTLPTNDGFIIGECAFISCSSISKLQLGSVKVIKDSAFAYCTSLTNVVIPKTCIEINKSPFFRCDNITSLTINDNNPVYTSKDNDGNEVNFIIEIQTKTIVQGLNIQNIIIPEGILVIRKTAFYSFTKIESVTLSSTVEIIEKQAFSVCNHINTIILPKSIKIIESFAFDNCTSLTYVYYEGSQNDWNSVNNLDTSSYLLSAEWSYNYHY